MRVGRGKGEVGFPTGSKYALQSSMVFGEICSQQGLELLVRVSGHAAAQAPAYPAVPKRQVMCWTWTGAWGLKGGLHPTPTCQQGSTPTFLRICGNTTGIPQHGWRVTQMQPKWSLTPSAQPERPQLGQCPSFDGRGTAESEFCTPSTRCTRALSRHVLSPRGYSTAKLAAAGAVSPGTSWVLRHLGM